ncbi:hypothetical protein F4809DRAFT_602092 [Biscogniauxia mediterranea]|nr:hypothetical protein F4809DRAFT_602092 [Biscogniauxia mediterranea]
MDTTGTFYYIDLSSIEPHARPWSKVDVGATSYRLTARERPVTDLRGLPSPSSFTTDNAGFALVRSPTSVPASCFLLRDSSSPPPSSSSSPDPIRDTYYAEVSSLLRAHLPAGDRVREIVIFDHTVRRRDPSAPRAPVTQVHVDQTAAAAAARVRRHVGGAAQAEAYLRPGRRFQLINVWRAVGAAAADMPLAVVDWRSTAPRDFVPVDLLYPKQQRRRRPDSAVGGVGAASAEDDDDDDDDRGKERRPDESTWGSAEGYEVRGETMAVAPSERHRFYYAKDLAPDEVLLLKCYDSWGEGEPHGGREGIAVRTPHTAFVDPATPADAPPRQSIEVRCLVFYDDE